MTPAGGVYWIYDGTNDPVRYELAGNNQTGVSGLDGLSNSLYISGYDYSENDPSNYDDDSSDAVYWIVSAGSNPQKKGLKLNGNYYTKDIVLDGGMVPQILGFTPNQSDQIVKWDDDGGIVTTENYTGLNPSYTMNIEVDENGDLNIMGNLSGDIMLWKEQQVRDDTDPFEKITIYDGTFPDTGEALAFDAEGNAVIAGQVWVSNLPVATCWVYDGVAAETIDLGEGFAKDVQIGENGTMYIAGYTYDWEACYWTVDSQGTVTQEILDTRESPGSYAYAILTQ